MLSSSTTARACPPQAKTLERSFRTSNVTSGPPRRLHVFNHNFSASAATSAVLAQVELALQRLIFLEEHTRRQSNMYRAGLRPRSKHQQQGGKTEYERARDRRMAELAEKLKPVLQARDEL